MSSVLQDYSEAQWLTSADFEILKAPFIQQVEELFPVPAQVSFHLPAEGKARNSSQLERGGAGEQDLADTAPEIIDDTLALPLKVAGEDVVRVVVQGVDPALIKKMGATWLSELQEQLYHRLTLVRLVYIDPKSGVYNKRAATLVCQDTSGAAATFIFLSVGIPSRTASVTINRFPQVCHLLQALCPGYLFSFDLSVFGVLLPVDKSRDCRKIIAYVQRQLKREGVRQVQVGYATGERNSELVEQAWEALLAAEKRGPFGVCDAVSQGTSPFLLPSDTVMAELNKFWNRKALFGVGVVSWDRQEVEKSEQDELAALLGEHIQVVAVEQGYSFLFFSGNQEAELQALAAELNLHKDTVRKLGVKGIGFALWPYLHFSRKQTVANCFKALLHSSFLDSGSTVVCDFLSFNISGDYYFDQGDFYSAAREYRFGLQLQPDDVNLLNSLGVTLVEFNQYTRAISCFKKVLEKQPDNYMTLVNLGRAQLELNQKRDAIATFERAREVIPGEEQGGSELFLPLGRLYTESGQPAQAIEVLSHWAAMPGARKEYLLYRLLGKNHFLDKNYPAAVNAAQKALQIYPQDSSSLSLLGVLYIIQGQGDDIGLRLCAEAIELDSANAENYYRQALGYFWVQQFDRARKSAQTCLHLDKGHVACGILVAQLDIEQKEKGKAKRRLDRLMKKTILSPAQKKEIKTILKQMEKKR